MSSVNERNAHALAGAIRADREKADALRERLVHLVRQVSMQAEAIASLQQRVALLQAARGHGATSR